MGLGALLNFQETWHLDMVDFPALSAECLDLGSPSNARQRQRFGLFEADLASGELYKHGRLIHIQEQPFRILAMLLERPGEVVSREEVRKKLWPDGTFVDFDEGLDTALKKLRQALGDSSQNPIFVETIPRRGYRFIAPVQGTGDGSSSNGVRPVGHEENSREAGVAVTKVAQKPPAGARLPRNVAAAVVSVAAIVAGAIILGLLSPPPVPKVSRIVQLSHSGRLDPWGGITTDRARLFFLEREGDHWNLMQAAVSGGESQPFASPFHNTRIFDISPDMSEFLVAPFMQRAPDLPLWTLPVVGGAPRRLGNIVGDDAAFSPDGTRIAYSTADGIYICSRTGTDAHKLVTLPESAWDLAWSPDAKVLRFTQGEQKTRNTSLWEISVEGENLHPWLPGWHQPPDERGGRWSPDGRYYYFLSCQEGICSIWVRREKSDFPHLSKRGPPVRLTSGPMSFDLLVPSQDGRRLFVTSGRARMEFVQQDRDSKQFVTRFKGAQTWDVRFSRNGDRIVLLGNDGNLWQSRPDGTERVQLTTQFSELGNMRWSPDGTKIVFDATKQGRLQNIYQVHAEGGAVEELLPEDDAHAYPDWSPDGESVVYSSRSPSPDAAGSRPVPGGIFVLDLKSRSAAKVPGSDSLKYPRWSPDGKYLAALSESDEKVMLFSFRTRRWNKIAHGNLLSALTWSPDAEYLYFEDILAPSEPIYRIRPAEAQTERVTDFETVLGAGAIRCQFAGFAPDGSVMAIVNRGNNDIYALELDLP
jgi:Tol biopolymer transport system component/DNA-binding winged helix-turn-helix (wHTH) protein